MYGIFTIKADDESYITTKEGWELIDGFVKFQIEERYYDYGTFRLKTYYIPVNCIKKIALGDVIEK